MTPDVVLGELEGLRALARSLVHGDADADDLLQEAAISAITHPPDADRPVRPWLAAVLRNRWRMDRRGRSRREAREQTIVADDTPAPADEVLDRARTLEKLATALVALEEPFRTVVMRRYLDGQTAAEIARVLGIPPGTVRWRLKTGLERLRAALDESTPRWKRAFIPFAAVAKGAVVVKAKTTAISLVLLLLLLVGGVIVWATRGGNTPTNAATKPPAGSPVVVTGSGAHGGAAADPVLALADPLPGQGRAIVVPVTAPGGQLQGRVINWSTGDGVADAELTFTNGSSAATTVRTRDDGMFDLSPDSPGSYTLAAIVATGFLPFAPELTHSSVRAELVANQAVRGVTVFLFPALPYHGHVVDTAGNDVASAKVRLVSTPQGEQAIEKLQTEWTTDAKGLFTFTAPDFGVLEAVRDGKRGFASVTGDVQTTNKLTITIGDAPARDGTIHGHTVEANGAPVGEVLVRAIPDGPPSKDHDRSVAFALTNASGEFVLDGLDKGPYAITAEADDFAPATQGPVNAGAKDVVITLDGGKTISGRVHSTAGDPIPAYTLLVMTREGVVRTGVVERSILDPRGEFSVRVPAGDYELIASAAGWAQSEPASASAGSKGIELVVAVGATLRGKVVDAATGMALQYARVMREGAGGGASAQPANAGTVTRADGTFELTGIPSGPLTFSIGAGEYHPRLEAGLTAVDGGVLGPIQIGLQKLKDGEQPKLQLVGIGVKLSADKDALKVTEVVPNSGAAEAGIVAGDRLTTIDGVPIVKVGIDGAVARIRGVAGTQIAIGLLRGETPMQITVTRKPLQL